MRSILQTLVHEICFCGMWNLYALLQYFMDTFIHMESGECIIRDFIKLFTNCYCPLQILKNNACFSLKVHPCFFSWMLLLLSIKSLCSHVLFMKPIYQIHGTPYKIPQVTRPITNAPAVLVWN